MATSVLTITFTDVWHDTKRMHAIGTIAIAAGDYVTNGFNLNLKAATATPGVGYWKSSRDPIMVRVDGNAGYKYEYDKANKKLIIRQSAASAAPMGQIAAAPVPGAIVSDIITFYAIGKALV